jgi:5-formyltetrahydrofolate cyclo-ligase
MPTRIAAPSRNDWEEVRYWRGLVRDDLIQSRTAISADERRALGKRACARLVQAVDLKTYGVLGFCWPIRGEFDVRGIAKQHLLGGGQVALPVIVQKSAAVEFWRWHPGMPMQTGIWNIPIPKVRDVLKLDAVIVPLVGYDESGFRLGYGGGYFDRTLAAALRDRPRICRFGATDDLSAVSRHSYELDRHGGIRSSRFVESLSGAR